MSTLPLEFERRFEQRWAARLARPVPPTVPHDHRHETPGQRLAALGKVKMKTNQAESEGLRSVAAVCARGD
jgi:hypothetical protein